ncbi:hypothetical protein CVU37_14865 [candidate division BRC1 bacterium HGW-BRC1-1]|jgi:hypothetical protein|nr:MAG: hypothetical protein CVU37_14865 [candidate division BRC1 bacterium HGW-BRC1-1]
MKALPAEIVVASLDADKSVTLFLDGRPFDRAAYESELIFFAQQHAMSAFDLGRRLIVYKEKAGHGNFVEFITDKLHFSPKYCSQLMAFARVVVAISTTAKGSIDLVKLAAMDQRKVLLLGEIAPEYSDELADLGTIDGRDIDQFDAMSRTQLRDEINRLKKSIDDGRDQLQKKSEKINDLDGKLRYLREVKPGAVARRCDDCFSEIAASGSKFRKTLPQGQTLSPEDIASIHRFREGVLHCIDSAIDFLAESYPDAYDDTPASVHRDVRRSLDATIADSAPAANIADIH